MTILKKNRDFTLRHVDLDTGYGLLYSHKKDECAFLNTLATAIWKIPLDHIDSEREPQLFKEVFKDPDAAEYMGSVIRAMEKRNLLTADTGADLADHGIQGDSAAGSKSDDPQLGQIYFYATRHCNARCYHCYQPTEKVDPKDKQKQDGQLGRERFLRFVGEAVHLGVRSVKITGGEPLLRNDLGEIIRGIRNLGLGVSIETNASLIDEGVADLFAELGVRTSISLDGGSSSVHDSLRGHPGSFDRVLHALRLLSERGCQPQIIMAISRRNMDEIENVLRIASQNMCRLVKLNPVNTLGSAHKLSASKILMSISEILSLSRKRKDLESKFGIFIFLEGPPAFCTIEGISDGHSAICPFTEIIGVLPDGSLSYCGIGNSYPELKFAHLDRNGFDIREYWKKDSTPLAQIRLLMSKKIGGVCGQCVLESLCKGSCRALAYAEFKDFLAPHPWCQSAYDEGLFPSQYLKPA